MNNDKQAWLDAFIVRAGFRHGWENLESWARRMAEHAWEESHAPIDMVLHCPACGKQHIDTSAACVNPYCECAVGECKQAGKAHPGAPGVWTNPPHRSHLCAGCGHIWRPADVPTNGVAAVKTQGKNDAPAPEAPNDKLTIADIRQDYCERVPAFYDALKYALGEKSWDTIYARLESQQFTRGDLICALAESLLDLRGV